MSLYGITYNIAGTLLAGLTLPIWLPYVLLRRKYRVSLIRRLGWIPVAQRRRLGEKPVIWLHAVSVGEFLLAHTLIRHLRPIVPAFRFVVSVTTLTGYEVARGKLDEDDILLFFPVEFYPVMRKVTRMINPRIAVIVETEIWPNFVYCLSAGQVPIIMVNGRISEKSFRRYRIVRPFFRDVLSRFRLFGMQTGTDARRVTDLGAAPEAVSVLGNIKFDSVSITSESKPDAALLTELALAADAPVFIAAALEKTGREDPVMLDVIEMVRRSRPEMALILVPRHPERGGEMAALVRARGYEPRRRSLGETFSDPVGQVYIVDTVGELKRFYNLARLVYVGKSLFAPGGGQNMIEPIALGKPTLYGPYTRNFRGIADNIAAREGALIVHSPDELAAAIIDITVNPDRGEALVRNGQQYIRTQQGATGATIEAIMSILNAREL